MNKKVLGIFVCMLVVLSVLSTATIANTLDPLEADAGGPYEGVVGEEIQFNGSATGGTPPYSWHWRFDDGTFSYDSYEEDPVYAYDTADVYTVVLVVIDSAGETAQNVTTATITEPEPLIADAGGPYEGLVGEEIQFDGSASGGTPPYKWHWGFGDGNTSNEEDPVHAYGAADVYSVVLVVIDSAGEIAKNVTTATITEPEPLIADANGPYEGLVGEETQFNGSATGGTPPYTWLWDFGDGNTSDEEDPVYTYDEADNYTVTLTVTDVMQNTDDDVTWATITEESGPIFEIEIVGGIGVNVFINNVGEVDATNASWSISIDGKLIFLGGETNGTIDIPAGEEVTVSSGLVLGLGKAEITVTVDDEKATADAFVLILFIIIR